jgi:hypothetical protein
MDEQPGNRFVASVNQLASLKMYLVLVGMTKFKATYLWNTVLLWSQKKSSWQNLLILLTTSVKRISSEQKDFWMNPVSL